MKQWLKLLVLITPQSPVLEGPPAAGQCTACSSVSSGARQWLRGPPDLCRDHATSHRNPWSKRRKASQDQCPVTWKCLLCVCSLVFSYPFYSFVSILLSQPMPWAPGLKRPECVLSLQSTPDPIHGRCRQLRVLQTAFGTLGAWSFWSR